MDNREASRAWARRNKDYKRTRRFELIANGICPLGCGNSIEVGKSACRICLNKALTRKKRNYRHIKETKYEKKQELIDLLGGKCVDCGYTGHIAGFEFDHIRDKKYAISNMLNQAHKWETILEEVHKCELVCATCHRIRTYKRRRGIKCGLTQT